MSVARPEIRSRKDAGGVFDVPGQAKLSLHANVYLFLVATAGAAAAAPLISRITPQTRGFITFAILGSLAALAQLFVVRTPRNQSYQTTIAFLIPAALLLPPELVALIAVVQHVPEWLKNRTAWYIQSFNVFNYTLAEMSAWGSARLVLRDAGFITDARVRWAAAGLAASVVFVAVNHTLLAPMLHLARGHSIRDLGLFSFESLSTDLVLAALGVGIASFWKGNPWLIPFVITPLVLIHRSLAVPQLQAEARVDPKTGLFNARHFAAALEEEMSRAARFERPLALIMADLDLLRDINNTYGHLAGDGVLKGIAEVFRAQLRHYDVPARFGGEEFSILLPETTAEQALEIAERVRRAVAERTFAIETSSEPIRATVSIGVAGFPKDATDPGELIHQADLAVYRAKLQGRNRVLGASSEPMLLPAERSVRLLAMPEDGQHVVPLPAAMGLKPERERRHPPPHTGPVPRFFHAAGLYALAVLAHPLLLMRKIQEAYLAHTQRSADKLSRAAETIQSQNVSLEQTNHLLKERSTAAIESLSATVDARDSCTAGHSQRVQQLALAIGRELGLAQAELDLLGRAALLHDVGKLAVPDSILLKPTGLTGEEWVLMQAHAEEGARIIDRLGFLNEAVPAIRHHHERFDGGGYPGRLKGEEIPLGARIIHVADALDSMLTTRIYRGARPAAEALDELRREAGTQFCPRVVAALERILPIESLGVGEHAPEFLAAS